MEQIERLMLSPEAKIAQWAHEWPTVASQGDVGVNAMFYK